MDYSAIYGNLIGQAKGRVRLADSSYEEHHIKPKCCGGLDDKSNLVLLTFREHYLAHRLLVKIYPNSRPLATALWLMTIATERAIDKLEVASSLDHRILNRIRSIAKQKKASITSYAYAFSRSEYVKHMVGHDVSSSTRDLISKNTKHAMQSKDIVTKCSSGSAHTRHYYDIKTHKAYKWFPGDPEIDISRFKYGRPPMSLAQKDKLSKLKYSSRVMVHNDELCINLPVYRSAVNKIPDGWEEKARVYNTGRSFRLFMLRLKNALLGKGIPFNMMFCYSPRDISKKKHILNPAFFDIFKNDMLSWRD